MANYSYQSWETINLPPVTGDTYFLITRTGNVPSGGDPSDIANIIYSGLVLDGFYIQNLEEILSQYVNPESLTFDVIPDHLIQDDEQNVNFYIFYTQDDWNTWTRDTVSITYNWSYGSTNVGVSDRIIDLVDYRQFFVRTMKPREDDTVIVSLDGQQIETLELEGGSIWTYIRRFYGDPSITLAGEFSYAYSYDFFVDRPFDSLTYTTDLHTLTIGGVSYRIANTCYNYCLFYLNEVGGWDYMLFAGKELQTDKLSRLSYKKNYVAQSTEFHKVDYLTTINETWSLNTSWLSDIQSSKMGNLLASNRLYLQDLNKQTITPVNITNSSFEHKTYKNQGRKAYTYTVEVSASQPKYRV